MISGKDIDWPWLTARGEWVGNRLDAEVEPARRDEMNDLTPNRSGSTRANWRAHITYNTYYGQF